MLEDFHNIFLEEEIKLSCCKAFALAFKSMAFDIHLHYSFLKKSLVRHIGGTHLSTFDVEAGGSMCLRPAWAT